MNLYCNKCGNHYKNNEYERTLEDDLKEHFYCKKCDVEMFREFELDDNNLDEMNAILKQVRELREELAELKYRFEWCDAKYFESWDNHPLEWESV